MTNFKVMMKLLTSAGTKLSLFAAVCGLMAASAAAQEPKPGPPRPVAIPAVKEIKLKSGLTVAVVEKKSVPLVSVQMLVKNGASAEKAKQAGLANLTVSLLTKGTKTRSATQIAEEIEFLGGNIGSYATWQATSIGFSVPTDKLDPAMTIFADVLLDPTFPEAELTLARTQALDDLTFSLTQPGFLANYVASSYSYGEHPQDGTPASLASITRDDVVRFYTDNYRPAESVVIFVGDITPEKAAAAAEKYFGSWRKQGRGHGSGTGGVVGSSGQRSLVKRFVVVDLPDSGQASVNFIKPVRGIGRGSKDYYSASVLNSLLGGGYSSRLNQEIRIKRGLSYGARSGFSWRGSQTNFSAGTQTKNESAAEVAELILAEIKRLGETVPNETELAPRRSVLTGDFGRSLETNAGLASALADLYVFGIPASELNQYVSNVGTVRNSDIRTFASGYLNEGDLIIVGDYAVFKDDLAKRFPNQKIDVIKATELDIESETLRKGDLR